MIIIWLTALATLAVDLGSKWLLTHNLRGQLWDLGPINVQITHNEVLAWGIPLGDWFPVFFSVVALALIAFLIWREGGTATRLEQVAWGLILGGGVANLVERLWLGYVTDFIDLGWFPVFNLADAAITIGAIVIICSWMFGGERAKK